MPIRLPTRAILRRAGGTVAIPTLTSPLTLGPKLWLDAQATGSVITDGAAQFTAANSESLTAADSDATSFAGRSWTICGWAKLDTKGTTRTILGKQGPGGTPGIEMLLWYFSTNDRFECRIGNGASASIVTANTFGSPTAGNWYFVAATWDNVSALRIKVNNGAWDTNTAAFTIQDTASVLAFGRQGDNPASFWDGAIDSFAKFDRVLSDAELTTLYNGGVGRTYADLATIGFDTTGLRIWMDMDEASGTRTGSHSAITFTDVNTVTAAVGISAGVASNGDPLKQWTDQSGNSYNMTQSTVSAKPYYKTGAINGYPAIHFDRTSRSLSGTSTSNLQTASAFTAFTVFTPLTFNTNGAAPYNNDGVWRDSVSTRVGLHLKATTPRTAVLFNDDGTYDQVSTEVTQAAPCVLVARHEGGNLYLNRNGGTDSTVASGDCLATATFQMGLGAGGTSLDGYIGEHLHFNKALTSTEISQVVTYLKNKWGIT